MIPAFSISAGGLDITGKINSRLISLRLTDKPGMEADELEIALSDHDAALALPTVGATLRVSIGWRDGGLTDKGSFVVDEVTHTGPVDQITIRARAAEFRGPLKEQREQAYHSHTLGDILTTIAKRLGLEPAIEAGLASIVIPHIDQTNESDANFLTRLGQDYDAVATIKDGRLLFLPIGHPLTVAGRALTAVTIARRDGDRHTYTEADRDGSVTAVKARWRDLGKGRARFAVAGEEKRGDDGSIKTLKRDFPSEAEAMAAAKAELGRLRRARREISVNLAKGRPEIIANRTLRLTGWRPEIDGPTWLAGEVVHTIDGQGFTTAISAQVAD